MKRGPDHEIPGYAQIKYHNLKRVFSIIRSRKSISRIELARETGLSAMSITRICSYLLEAGLIREGTVGTNSVGRKAVLLEPCANVCFSFCISIDYCAVQMAIYDLLLTQTAYCELPVKDGTTYEQIIDLAAITLKDMASESGVPLEKIYAVGISCVGSVHAGVLEFVAQFLWSNVKAADYAERVFHLPVFIENDCKAALIGEQAVRFGLNSPENVAYITIGKRGVGSAVTVNGKLLRGTANLAGEIGHIIVELNGMPCDCGRRGCLQTFLAEQFVLERARTFEPSLSNMRDLMDAAAGGNSRIAELLEQVNQYVAVALNIVACAYNPDVIFLNDSYFPHGYLDWYQHSKAQMPSLLFNPISEHIQVETTVLGPNASLFGMSCILQDEILRIKFQELPGGA